MILKTKTVLVDLDSMPLLADGKELTFGVAISLQLIKGENCSDPLKAYDLAKKFHSQEEVDVDTSDVVFLKDSMKKGKTWLPLVIGQVLTILENIKK